MRRLAAALEKRKQAPARHRPYARHIGRFPAFALPGPRWVRRQAVSCATPLPCRTWAGKRCRPSVVTAHQTAPQPLSCRSTSTQKNRALRRFHTIRETHDRADASNFLSYGLSPTMSAHGSLCLCRESVNQVSNRGRGRPRPRLFVQSTRATLTLGVDIEIGIGIAIGIAIGIEHLATPSREEPRGTAQNGRSRSR